MNSEIFALVILPILIFLSQVVILTVGTVRIILLSKGNKALSPVLGFFEVLIWLLAVSQIVQNLENPIYYIAYATGFALGNVVGVIIEERLAVGTLLVRVITKKRASKLIKHFRDKKLRLTNVPATGEHGKVNILYIVIKRKRLREVIGLIKHFHPKSFFSVEDVKYVNEGNFPLDPEISRRSTSLLRR